MKQSLKQGFLALPGISVSMLPKLICPLCWPVYAGLLSSVGLSFLISTAYLLPLTAASLVLALGALGFRACNRHGHVPFFLGLLAAIFVLLGKFVWLSNPTMYGAVSLLVIASLWNAWPRHDKANQESACSNCKTETV
jgi:mercuric ion transport protein